MEGSWEGIAGGVVHVAVHGECVCCGSHSRRDVLGWLLFMVTKYLPTECFVRTKLTF